VKIGGEIMSTNALTVEELSAKGWCYQFDKNVLIEQFGEDGSQNYLRDILHSAVLTLKKHRSKRINKGPFHFWYVEKKVTNGRNEYIDGIVWIVTPFYEEIVRRSSDIEPLIDQMRSYVGFIRTESASPVFEGAIPMFHYEDGDIVPIPLNNQLIEHLSDIYEELLYWNSQFDPGLRDRGNPYHRFG
jgi:hypothetical protein